MSIAPASRAFKTARYSKSPPSSVKYCGSVMQARIGVDFIQHFRAAQRLHLIQYPFTPLLNVPRRRCRRKPLRVRQYGGEHGGIGAREPGGGFAEVALRGRFGAVRAVAEFGDVQIHLQYPPLRPQALDQDGEVGLEPLAKIAASR